MFRSKTARERSISKENVAIIFVYLDFSFAMLISLENKERGWGGDLIT